MFPHPPYFYIWCKIRYKLWYTIISRVLIVSSNLVQSPEVVLELDSVAWDRPRTWSSHLRIFSNWMQSPENWDFPRTWSSLLRFSSKLDSVVWDRPRTWASRLRFSSNWMQSPENWDYCSNCVWVDINKPWYQKMWLKMGIWCMRFHRDWGSFPRIGSWYIQKVWCRVLGVLVW